MASNNITHQQCKDYRLNSDAMQGPKVGESNLAQAHNSTQILQLQEMYYKP